MDLREMNKYDDGAVAMTQPVPITGYHSYRDLPMLAGLATVAEAARPGLSVEACVGATEARALCFQTAP